MEIPQELYRTLKIQCTQGETKQNEIFNQYGINVDESNLVDYTRYLVNLTVANEKTQSAVFNILPSIPLASTNSKFLLMIANNILADQPFLTSAFLSSNLNLLNLIIHSLIADSDELFEWSFYLVAKLHPGNFFTFFNSINLEDYRKFLGFLASNCEKNWKESEKILPGLFKFEDFRDFSEVFDKFEDEILILGNYVSRDLEEQQTVAEIFLTSGFLEKCFKVLGKELSEGMRGVVLQILSNTLFESTIGIMNQNVGVVLKSAELDVKQPTCREWVFVIIRKGVQLSEEFKETLQKLYDAGMAPVV